jgi:hypothetical protein
MEVVSRQAAAKQIRKPSIKSNIFPTYYNIFEAQ